MDGRALVDVVLFLLVSGQTALHCAQVPEEALSPQFTVVCALVLAGHHLQVERLCPAFDFDRSCTHLGHVHHVSDCA